ncbi:hypothetical protein F5B21DRAFT_28360 [Xylaria acuta]|nr:hypothetical protein F5B21DRAFT_28360 [Xylaria acuta]
MAETTSPRPRILYSDAGPEPPFPLRMEGAVISGFGRGSKELGIPTANLPVDAAAAPWIADARSGVYFGWASLALPATHPDSDSTSSTSTSTSTTTTSTSTTTTATTTTPAANNHTSSSSSTATDNDDDAAAAATQQQQQQQQQLLLFQIYPMVMSIGYNPFYKNSVRSAEVHVLRSFGADFYDAPMRLLILGFVRDEKDYAGLDALVEDIRVDCDVARQSLAREAWTPVEGVVGGARGTLDGSWLVR